MTLHLIRHAEAGSRAHWSAPDAVRPLTAAGEDQARQIEAALDAEPIARVLSSPAVRCRQTVEPLAARRGLEVVDAAAFAEGGYGSDALDAALEAVAAHGTVAICSHGDIIPALVAAARRRGAHLDGAPSPAKGARYECTVVDGQITHLLGVDAPAITVDRRPDPRRSVSAAPSAR